MTTLEYRYSLRVVKCVHLDSNGCVKVDDNEDAIIKQLTVFLVDNASDGDTRFAGTAAFAPVTYDKEGSLQISHSPGTATSKSRGDNVETIRSDARGRGFATMTVLDDDGRMVKRTRRVWDWLQISKDPDADARAEAERTAERMLNSEASVETKFANL